MFDKKVIVPVMGEGHDIMYVGENIGTKHIAVLYENGKFSDLIIEDLNEV